MSKVSGDPPQVVAPDMEVSQTASGLFVRKATGLVRELTIFDTFNMVFGAVLVPLGITGLMGFAPSFWPGANLLVALVVATPFVACFGLTYVYFTIMMPRSGGDYVFLSRTVHPSVGFVVNFSLTFVFLSWIAFSPTVMLPILASSLAYTAGWTAQWLVAPGKGEIMLVATIMAVGYTALMLLRVRWAARFMAVMFVLVWAGMAVWFILMLVGTRAGFVHRWNTESGTTYASVLHEASHLGFTPAAGIAWVATLFAITYVYQGYTGFHWTGYFAGEIQNIRRSANISIMGGLFASAAAYVVGVALVYKYYGTHFFASVVYLGLGSGSSHYKLGFAPYVSALIRFLPGPRFLLIFAALAFVLAVFWWIPAGYMLGTRNLFAWSFDGLAPTGVTTVSDRFHTPVVATILIGCVVELLSFLNIYEGFNAFLLNILALMGVCFIVVSVAAVFVPWRHPELHALAPGWARRRLLGLPLIVPIALASAAAWAFVVWAAFHSGFGGSLTWGPMSKVFLAPGIGVVWYLIAWTYRRRKGVDLAKVFREIPPE
jgi:APA family basic amino acid/polyamine antiporter